MFYSQIVDLSDPPGMLEDQVWTIFGLLNSDFLIIPEGYQQQEQQTHQN